MQTYYCYPLDRCGKILARVEVEAPSGDDAVAAGWEVVAANSIYDGLEVWLERVRVFPEHASPSSVGSLVPPRVALRGG